MNAEPVLIEDDDDVESVPVVVLDDDDEQTNNKKIVNSQKIVTIDLDDDTPIETTARVKVNKPKNITKPTSKKSDTSFKNGLRNNRLMDKIVSHCLSMDDAGGMPRVIHKTLLPLYRDTVQTFKGSELLRAILKKTYKLLVRDPDHKFLHIKTLCEDLKKGGLWRKVPLVTLATGLKHKSFPGEFKELTSSSRPISQNKNDNTQSHTVNESNYNTRSRGPAIMGQSNQINSCTTTSTERVRKRAKRTHIENKDTDSIEKEKTVINLDDSDDSVELNTPSNDPNDVIVVSDKENNIKSGESSTSDDEMDYELLIPQTHIEAPLPEPETNINAPPSETPIPPDKKNEKELVEHLERQIARFIPIIKKLEQEEVTSHGTRSAYHQCAQYKERVVQLYKQICTIQGKQNGLVKHSKIHLHVAEGYAPGPARLLEQFLNSTMHRTGTVEFPNFSDVVTCVVQANFADKLAWSKQRIIEEAIALFRNCGHALRKRRQQREYKDLLKFADNMNHADDPAEQDPILLAKLEENKKRAKIKEEEILERFVKLEDQASSGNLGISGAAVDFEDSISSDDESEHTSILSCNRTTATINDQPNIEERSTTNNSVLSPPNTNITCITAYDQPVKTENFESSCVNNNNLDVTPTSPTANSPMLLKLLNTPQDQTYLQNSTFNDNQCQTGESSTMNSEVLTNTTTLNSDEKHTYYNIYDSIKTEDEMDSNCNIFDCIKTEDEIDSKIDSNENSEISLTDIKVKSVENSNLTANNEQNGVSTTNESEQNCDSSISKGVVIKTENHESENGETLDIQKMLDELGSNFVCQVFDVEDPFLVIEISSDECSDEDDEL